jgi:hypothetical protein
MPPPFWLKPVKQAQTQSAHRPWEKTRHSASRIAKYRSPSVTTYVPMPAVLSTLRLSSYNAKIEKAQEWSIKHEIASFLRPSSQRGPAYCLRKLCLRIRWSMHPYDRNYNLRQFFSALRARLMIGLLERRLISYQPLCIHGLAPWLSRGTLLRLTVLINLLMIQGHCEREYSRLLGLRLAGQLQRKTISLTTNASMLHRQPQEPGYRFKTHIEYVEDLRRSCEMLPAGLKDKPISKQYCWCCHSNNAPTKICERCNLARYCGVPCARANWPEHKALCKSIEGTFSKEHKHKLHAQMITFYEKCENRVKKMTYAQALCALQLCETVPQMPKH